jgi:hypothetical protein
LFSTAHRFSGSGWRIKDGERHERLDSTALAECHISKKVARKTRFLRM